MSVAFGDMIKQLRTEKGLSQARLAELTYVTRSTIARWETGSRMPDTVMISRLAKSLGVDAARLFSLLSAGEDTINIIMLDDESIILNGGLPVLEEVFPDAIITGYTKPSEALEYARSTPVTLAFLDIEMGPVSGLEICRELDVQVNDFKERPLTERYPFVIVDALYIKVREDRRVNSKAFQVAIGFNPNGKREVIGFEICDSETKDSWASFLNELANRGLTGVDLFVSDANRGIQEAVKKIFPTSCWQRCQAHFMRNILDKCPNKYFAGLAADLKRLFSAETVEEARRLRDQVFDEYSDVCPKAMEILDSGFEDSMTVMAFPRIYRIPLRTTNYIERENREIRKRENVIGIFPNRESALRLIGAILLDDSNDWLTSSRAFKMDCYFDNREAILKKARRSVA